MNDDAVEEDNEEEGTSLATQIKESSAFVQMSMLTMTMRMKKHHCQLRLMKSAHSFK